MMLVRHGRIDIRSFKLFRQMKHLIFWFAMQICFLIEGLQCNSRLDRILSSHFQVKKKCFQIISYLYITFLFKSSPIHNLQY